MLKPNVIKCRMPRLWRNNHRTYVVGKDKLFIKFPVKEKIKIVFGMASCNSFQAFKGKPPNPFEFAFY